MGGTRISLTSWPMDTPEANTASVSWTSTVVPRSSPSSTSTLRLAHVPLSTPGVDPGMPSHDMAAMLLMRPVG